MYNKFYFLHIQKTGGRFFKENFIVPNWNSMINSGISQYSGESHSNWNLGYIDENTYIVSFFRNPIHRIISDYAHDAVLDASGKRVVPVGKSEKINKKIFMSWIEEKSLYIQDFQCKNILLDGPLNSFEFNLNNENLSTIRERIDNIQIFFKTENLNNKSLTFIMQKIINDLSIKESKNQIIFKNDLFKNEDSNILLSLLSKSDIRFIEELFQNDLEIYNTEKLFLKVN